MEPRNWNWWDVVQKVMRGSWKGRTGWWQRCLEFIFLATRLTSKLGFKSCVSRRGSFPGLVRWGPGLLALRTRERTLIQEKPEARVTDCTPAGREQRTDVSEETKCRKAGDSGGQRPTRQTQRARWVSAKIAGFLGPGHAWVLVLVGRWTQWPPAWGKGWDLWYQFRNYYHNIRNKCDKLGVVAHTCSPHTWEAELGWEPQVQGQPRL